MNLYLARFSVRRHVYPDKTETEEDLIRLIEAEGPESARDKLEKAVEVWDPYGISEHVERAEITSVIK